jgi:hypothetical protein
MFLSRWTAHEQWNITFILLKTRREEGHQFVNLLPDRHAKFVIIQWITCVLPKLANLLMHSQCASIVPRKTWRKLWHSYISKLFLTKMQVKFSIFFHHGSLNVIGEKFRFCKQSMSVPLSSFPWILASSESGQIIYQFYV